MKQTLICTCKCGDPSHQIVFQFGDDEVYMTVHLVRLPFWKRLKAAFNYLFGRKRCIYGDFDEVILDPEDIDKFKSVVKYLEYVSSIGK